MPGSTNPNGVQVGEFIAVVSFLLNHSQGSVESTNDGFRPGYASGVDLMCIVPAPVALVGRAAPLLAPVKVSPYIVFDSCSRRLHRSPRKEPL